MGIQDDNGPPVEIKLPDGEKDRQFCEPPSAQFFKNFPFDETISATFHGRRESLRTRVLKGIVDVSSLGTSYLVSRWLPSLKSRLSTEPSFLRDATHIFVVNSFGQSELVRADQCSMQRGLYGRFVEGCAKAGNHERTVDDVTDESIVSIDYRCSRFILNPLTGLFLPVHAFPRVHSGDVDVCEEGLRGEEQICTQRLLFGRNEIAVASKTIGQLLVSEILHPFNIFQIFSIIVWSCEDYYYYAMIILLMTSVSVAVTLYETMENQKKLQEMAYFSSTVRVQRDGRWVQIGSEDLVPGDVIDLEPVETVPCDLILLNGDAVVDESMLTGEAIPLTKSSISYEEFREFYATNKESLRYTLFSGTRLLRSRPRHGRPATGLVLNIGFMTAKGSLIQSILFPRPNKFSFYRDSMIFVGVLGIIACFGFIGGMVVMIRLGYDWVYIITRALDLITVVIPPALPATMSVGAIFALSRLKEKGIFCMSPPRINVCAKVSVICFDKTGTLTEEGLDVLGVVPNMPNQEFTSVPPLMKLTPSVAQHSKPLIQLMATCHSIQRINDELVGDPLDLKMFAFSGWILEEAADDVNEAIVPIIIRPPGSQSFDLDEAINPEDDDLAENGKDQLQEMGVIRCFEFNAGIRMMSVIARELESEKMLVMTKGSPESIKSICSHSSIPPDYDSCLAKYSHAGYRVIACAFKPLPEGTSWLKVQRMLREQVESDLLFAGFLLFENKLKPQTLGVIKTLTRANISNVMVTGDNLHTAVAVARACGMIPPGTAVFVPNDDEQPEKDLKWSSLETGKVALADPDLLPFVHQSTPYALAITGSVFEHLRRESSCQDLLKCISKCRVFARMSPQQKQTLVEMYQFYGMTVGFCGDGANDCGALKAADVGISLSAAEASVAAPFTSRQQHIGCVVDLLREGRAALATSFSCFKFMALYSMIQFTTLTLMYIFKTSLSDGQFIYIDLILIIPFGVLLSRYGPASAIHPQQPTARLISSTVLISILGQVVLQFIYQSLVAFTVASRFNFRELTSDRPSENGNSALFVSSIFLYSSVAWIFSFGYPHRQRVFWPFIAFLVLTFVAAGCLCVWRINWLDDLLSIGMLSKSEGFAYLIIAAVHFVLAYLYESFLAPKLALFFKYQKELTLQPSV